MAGIENREAALEEAVAALRSAGFTNADAGIVLGTGLGALIDAIDIEREIFYSDIPHFPEASVEFHQGRLVQARIGEKRVTVMQGRFHYYEGYPLFDVTFPIRVLHKLGIEMLMLSNAAGSIRNDWKKGTLMLIDDHIDLQPESPLRGRNMKDGIRFPDMSDAYSKELRSRFQQAADGVNVPIVSGIYTSVKGPNLETAAEYRMLRNIGADAVGMSTIPEVQVAAHLKLPCIAVSVLTDECDPDDLKPVDIADIIATAGQAEKDLVKITERFLSSGISS